MIAPMQTIEWQICFGNLSPTASRTSTSDLPTRSLAAANPPRSGTVSKSHTMTLGFMQTTYVTHACLESYETRSAVHRGNALLQSLHYPHGEPDSSQHPAPGKPSKQHVSTTCLLSCEMSVLKMQPTQDSV